MNAYLVRVTGKPGDTLVGKYIEGPRSPRDVKYYGYGFTFDVSDAWLFPNERQARAKAKIVARHMSMRLDEFEVLSA